MCVGRSWYSSCQHLVLYACKNRGYDLRFSCYLRNSVYGSDLGHVIWRIDQLPGNCLPCHNIMRRLPRKQNKKIKTVIIATKSSAFDLMLTYQLINLSAYQLIFTFKLHQ